MGRKRSEGGRARRSSLEPPRIPGEPSRPGGWVYGVAAVGVVVLIATSTLFRMANNDVWIHLKTGERILETRQFPDKDPYSYDASDRDYVAHEWLAAVLFHLVYSTAGVNGLIFLKAAVVLATCAVLYGISRVRGDRLVLWVPLLSLALFVGSARFLERPHVFSYLFVALYLLAYYAFREAGRRWALYCLPPLHVVWTNTHGGHYAGIFLLAALAGAEIATFLRARWIPALGGEALPPRELAKVCAAPVACLGAALVNPYGLRLLTFPFELTGQQVFMRGELAITEWQSSLHPAYNGTAMFLLYVVWTALLLGSFHLVGEDRGLPPGLLRASGGLQLVTAVAAALFVYELARTYRSPRDPSLLEQNTALWCGAAVLWLLARAHRLAPADLGISALFFALSLRHNRAVTDAVVATLPVLCRNANRAWDRYARREPPSGAVALVGALALALALSTALWGYPFTFHPPTTRRVGLGVAGNMPVGAVEYLARNGITGRAFNSYDAGGLMIHRLWPGVRVGMDSRNDVYGETLYREYVAALQGGDALEAHLRKWSVDVVLVTYKDTPAFAFFRYLDGSPEWAPVYEDRVAIVYLRRVERFADVIRRDTIAWPPSKRRSPPRAPRRDR